MKTKVREALTGVLDMNRHPMRRKTAWKMTILWALALAVAVFATIANLYTRDWLWLIFTMTIGAFDFVMLHSAITGLVWRIDLDRWLASRTSPGRGSTGE